MAPREAIDCGDRVAISSLELLKREADEVREYAEREEGASAERFGSLADKLRGALKPREK